MSSGGGWYGRVINDPSDLTPLVDAIAYFETQLIEARNELKLDGQRVEAVQKRLPGMAEYRFNQLQELEAILNFLNIRLAKVKGQTFRKYMENYNRSLSSRDAEKYSDSDDDVVSLAMIINQVALLRNKFLGVTKGIEYLHFQLGNITKLRTAGIEDATL
jgi:hypothetical protein